MTASTQPAIETLDGGYAWVCDLCGQLLPEGQECNSGYHVGPSGETKGKPIRSDALTSRLSAVEADLRRKDEALRRAVAFALVLGQWDSGAGDAIGQETWETLHEEFLLSMRRDETGEARILITEQGYAELLAALAPVSPSQPGPQQAEDVPS